MSRTRHADPGGDVRQEKWCSSYESGLYANAVARRCQSLPPEDRDCVYFLLYRSHAPGGLKRVAADLRTRFADRIGTPSMLKFSRGQKERCTAAQVRKIRNELPPELHDRFLLRGELSGPEEMSRLGFGRELAADVDAEALFDLKRTQAARRARVADASDARPRAYPIDAFAEVCREASEGLEACLAELCLNPGNSLKDASPWYFPGLTKALREYHEAWVEAQRKDVVVTEIGKRVYETLDFALEEKCLVAVEGLARMGKTFAAKQWCAEHPGRARYVQVPSTNDENSFLREIARALGLGCGQSLKGSQIRTKVENTLRSGDLMLVFDEGWALWPMQSRVRDTWPRRIVWVMTALVNHGVPCAIVSTPQFTKSQKVIEKGTHWTSEQFIGRIIHFEQLPATLSAADLRAVAKVIFPEGQKEAIDGLVAYARNSAKYLAGVEAVVKRARFVARRAGRAQATTVDIRNAMRDSVVPSDSALAQALGLVKRSRKGSGKRAAAPLQDACSVRKADPDSGQGACVGREQAVGAGVK